MAPRGRRQRAADAHQEGRHERRWGRPWPTRRPFHAAESVGESALKYLPRFLLYNPLNPWGRHRELPAVPEADVSPVVPREPEENMSPRDAILAAVRKNLPRPAVPLPEIPHRPEGTGPGSVRNISTAAGGPGIPK